MTRNLDCPVVVFAAILFLNTACSKDVTNRTIISLEGDVHLRANVFSDSLKRSLLIYSNTETVYHCLGFTIDMDTRVRNGKLKMCCSEVFQDGICPDAFGAASHTWDLGNLNPGEYPIEVQIGKEKNTGTLIVEEKTASFKFDELNRLQIF